MNKPIKYEPESELREKQQKKAAYLARIQEKHLEMVKPKIRLKNEKS